MQPGVSTVINTDLVLKSDLESQEGNRSPGLYSSIYTKTIAIITVIGWTLFKDN